MNKNPLSELGNLGEHLREQREAARLSLRQLADLAGVSNPYLSQIERGLKRPSAEILSQLAKALQVSAESLYVRAGILEERAPTPVDGPDVRAAIAADPLLTDRQRTTLLDVYESFVAAAADPDPKPAQAKKSGGKAAAATLPKTSNTNSSNTKTSTTKTTTKTTQK